MTSANICAAFLLILGGRTCSTQGSYLYSRLWLRIGSVYNQTPQIEFEKVVCMDDIDLLHKTTDL